MTAGELSNDEIRMRDGYRCARCGGGDTWTIDVHHRFPRSGGNDERASNRVSLCRNCHRWAHQHPLDAQAEGWIVTAELDPAAVPVRHWAWPDGPVLLLDEYAAIQIWQPDTVP